MELMMIMLVLVVAVCIYFTPAEVAYKSKRQSALGIFFLNLFLGWTLVGWVAALIWAVSGKKQL